MTDYDDYLYSDYPHEETHPDRLATLGRLYGLRPAHPGRCRVLELGCGLGGNLVAVAVALPRSTFLGIDR
jgi:tRNA G46 methylase TrmB